MMSAARRIALFGQFGADNLGNEATLAVTLAALRRRAPNTDVVLLSDMRGPDLPGGRLESVPPDPWPVPPSLLRALPWRAQRYAGGVLQLLTEPQRRRVGRTRAGRFDLLVVPGTGIADDFYQGPFDTPFDLLRWCQVARLNGAPIRFASVGAGPVANVLSRRWIRRALALADYRSYREPSSKQFALGIGVAAEQDAVLPDLAFGLDRPAGYRAAQWPPKAISLGVMAYQGWNDSAERGRALYADYMRRLIELGAALLERGYDLRLLIGQRRDDRRPAAELAAALADRASGDAVVRYDAIATHEDVLQQIAATDLVIATRFHNVLFALSLERPVISLEYAAKNSDLMADMGLAELCHHIQSFDPARVLAQVEALSRRSEPPLARLRERLVESRSSLELQFDRLFQV